MARPSLLLLLALCGATAVLAQNDETTPIPAEAPATDIPDNAEPEPTIPDDLPPEPTDAEILADMPPEVTDSYPEFEPTTQEAPVADTDMPATTEASFAEDETTEDPTSPVTEEDTSSLFESEVYETTTVEAPTTFSATEETTSAPAEQPSTDAPVTESAVVAETTTAIPEDVDNQEYSRNDMCNCGCGQIKGFHAVIIPAQRPRPSANPNRSIIKKVVKYTKPGPARFVDCNHAAKVAYHKAFEMGYRKAFNAEQPIGYEEGKKEGLEEGKTKGHEDGLAAGKKYAAHIAFIKGHATGVKLALAASDPRDQLKEKKTAAQDFLRGLADGNKEGYDSGYEAGVAKGKTSCAPHFMPHDHKHGKTCGGDAHHEHSHSHHHTEDNVKIVGPRPAATPVVQDTRFYGDA